MKSKMILGELEMAPCRPDAGVFRGYENLRRKEEVAVHFNVEECLFCPKYIRIWEENGVVYATMWFLKAAVGDFFEGYQIRVREKSKNNDVISIRPVLEQTYSILFSEYQINKLLHAPDDTYVLEIYTKKQNVYKLEDQALHTEKDFRKWFLEKRKNGDPSTRYINNLYAEGRNVLRKREVENKREILPDNEYTEIPVQRDAIAKRTLNEMLKEGAGEYINDVLNIMHIYKGSKNPYKELVELEGLDDIKEDVRILANKLKYHKNRKARGKVNPTSSNMHMCFMGGPGTGKTTLARIMVGILYEMGIIENNEFIEIAATDLKAQYANQTAKRTELVLRSAYGRVLFIDEAYALASDDKKDYGREAINEILKQMEDNRDKLIIIFAGYKGAMQEFLDMNTGFRSRINRYYEFKDFSAFECTNMVIQKFEQTYGFSTAAIIKLYWFFVEAKNLRGFGNIRTVKMVCNKIAANWAHRRTFGEVDKSASLIIEEEDIPEN